jgi:hypothetical protein
MTNKNYSTTISVPVTATQAYEAINNVRAWWSTIFEGDSQHPNDIYTVRFGETYITIKVTELIPDQKISWLVTDCHKHWLKDKKEWVNTSMTWEISTDNGTTQIHFTHHGLVPELECYNGCEKGWNYYIHESLYKLLTEGKGLPELK